MSVPASNPYGSPTAAAPMGGTTHLAGRSRSMMLRRIDPLSCGKMLGCLYAILGLLMGAIVLVFGAIGLAGGAGAAGGGDLAAGIGGMLFMAVMAPFFYGVMGFIGGLISALLYNLCGAVVGGIEMQFEE